MVAIIFSAIVAGHMSDKFGRKKVLWVSISSEIFFGFLSIWSPDITSFIIIRFLLGFAAYGRNLTGFLMAVETTGQKYRAVVGMGVTLGWATGYCLLPLIAYYVNNFRHLFFCLTVPEILWLVWLWWIPESPRWLMTAGKFDEAEKIVSDALRMNGRSKDFKREFESLKEKMVEEKFKMEDAKNQNFFDLWRNSTITIYTLIFYFEWFTNAFVYYGISLNAGSIDPSSLYWNFFWTGLIEFPSYLFCMFILKYVGRRKILAIMMFGVGCSCLGVLVTDTRALILIVSLTGKFCITSSFQLLYVYSAEVYPTMFRQVGLGSCSVAGRFGSILAPFMKEFTSLTSITYTMVIYGILSLICTVISLKLPETKDKEIPDTIEDVKKLSKN